MTRRASFSALIAVAAVAAMGGCASSDAAAAKIGACLRPVASATPSPSTFGGPQASPAPDVSLECLDGSGPARLMKTGAPLVVNLWATYCAPCQAEMPAMQAFANAAAGQVGVVGVDERDPASYGSSFVADHHVTYPMLSDPDAKLSAALGRNSLPLTLFVHADGGLAYIYVSPDPLDKRTLADLVERYLGVRVTV